MRFSLRMRASRCGIESGSTLSGHSPSSPHITALSVPWPRPVSASEPNNSQVTRAVRDRLPASSSHFSTKRAAARIGPTVCEDDGPMPILKRSKTLTAMLGMLGRKDGYSTPRLLVAGCRLLVVGKVTVPTTDNQQLTTMLLLYQRDDCKLCDEAIALLAAVRAPEFESVWIDDDAELEARYGERVPVLRYDTGDRELDWPFDLEGLRAFLDSL